MFERIVAMASIEVLGCCDESCDDTGAGNIGSLIARSSILLFSGIVSLSGTRGDFSRERG